MNRSERHLILFLRITAAVLLAAAGAVFMPKAWMDAIHEWQGLGAFPDMPIVGYLTRSMSALYASMGAAYWFMSRDVHRYLPLLRFTVPITFAFDVTVIAIDIAVGMPWQWTLGEGPFLLGWTLALWLLVRRIAPDALDRAHD